MSSYIPNKCFVVCTKQMGFGYRRLLVDGEVRRQISVILKTGDRPFLTVADRKIDEDFECQSQWSSTVAWGSFAGGAPAAVAITAISVGWIPVAGWIAVGVVAAVAIVATLAVGVIAYFANQTKCSDRLRSLGSAWIVEHSTVTFDGYNAVNKRSILQCQEGGSLLPFISESLARDAAFSISIRNLADVGINGLATFISGFFLMLGVTTGLGLLAAGAWFGFGMLFGAYVINPATDWQKEQMREDSDIGGETYDRMNENDVDAPSSIGPDTEWNPRDNVEVYQDLQRIKRLGKKNGATSEQIAQIDRAIASAERNGSFSPKKNPEMQGVIDNIKNGVYGENVRRTFTNRSGNMRGMNRRANYEKAAAAKRQLRRARRIAQAKRGGKAGGNIIQIIQPFASTYFSERAREYAAMYAEQDMGNGVGVVAQDN